MKYRIVDRIENQPMSGFHYDPQNQPWLHKA